MSSIVLTGACVRTMKRGAATAEAIAFADERIVAVGTREQVLRAAGAKAREVQLGGATVLPGFIDAHHHVAIAALYGGSLRLTPPQVTDIASLQTTLARAARALTPEQWLVATAWDETLLRERRPPTRAELDDAVPDRPAFLLHHTCHRGLANSRALELAGIDAATPEPSGGAISRGARGVPDGLLIERGMSRVESLARAALVKVDAPGIRERIAAHQRALVAVGITRVADTAVPRELLELYRELSRQGELLVPTHACPVSVQGWLEAPRDVLAGPKTGESDGVLTIGPVKLVFDGTPGCTMCLSWGQALGATLRAVGLALGRGSLDPIRTAMSIAPRLGRTLRSGIAIYRHEEAAQMVGSLTERGFAVATHAVGNEAVEVALDAYQAAGSSLHRAGVPRLEHAAFAGRELVARMGHLGIAAVVQPAMLAMHMYSSAARIPRLPFFPLRWMADAGVLLVGSSDHPVDTFDPLAGIRSAIGRHNARGETIDAEQRLTLDESLAMYTRTAAEVLGCGTASGTLEAGKRADLVVIDNWDDTLTHARVRATVIAGRTVFGEV